ncbi:MAG: aminopeptidase P family protein, partial [Alphaproteobacteria bacterium]|nr:aminopeptidase P family protein [Alphaproteobacteria bacterium]
MTANGDGLGDGPAPAERLDALRAELERRGLDGFVVPHADAHQGEYLPRCSERLWWLTGFKGSAGTAVVLRDRAALFTDGRYTLQAGLEVDARRFEVRHLVEQPPHAWIGETLPAGARLGYDPWLHTCDGAERLREACERAGGELVPCEGNPVDVLWRGRPGPPLAPVIPHPLEYAGLPGADKRRRLGEDLGKAKADAVVLTAPDSIAWLLNIRGGDVPFSPLPLAFAVVHADARVDLFLDPRKASTPLSAHLAAHLGPEVRLLPPEALAGVIDGLGKARVRLDPAGAAVWFMERLRAAGARVERGADPCALPKACKNDVELNGARAAHRRDGAALARFLCWLEREAPKRYLTESSAADRLEAFRGEEDLFRGPSFATISGAGPNGAIVHYRVSPETDRLLEPGMLYLVDSGAQYLDGTTDVTRTVAIGDPTGEQKRRFTQVLKGHIAIASVRFPPGTTGSQLDVLARRALWADGVDYDHGTGHGVGSYLGVHEGPQRISKIGNGVALQPGMILSNEPGFYKAGEYGIRIENLQAVVTAGPSGG